MPFEVLLTADNHPSNHTAWQQKAKRFGFTVIDIPVPNPHPGPEHYIDAFTKAITFLPAPKASRRRA